jgi:hypothetical protein
VEERDNLRLDIRIIAKTKAADTARLLSSGRFNIVLRIGSGIGDDCSDEDEKGILDRLDERMRRTRVESEFTC